jgi:trehalose 6-phosphate phosphatase
MVMNVVAAGAPDKGQAIEHLIARSGAAAVAFAGDDLNDEAVFVRAGPGWLTVRVGCDDSESRALFCLEGPDEMAAMLDCMLACLVHPCGAEDA